MTERLEPYTDPAHDALTPQPMATAPTDGTDVLAYWPDPISGAPRDNGAWVESWFGPYERPGFPPCWQSPFEYGIDFGPTHWLPLPPRPADE